MISRSFTIQHVELAVYIALAIIGAVWYLSTELATMRADINHNTTVSNQILAKVEQLEENNAMHQRQHDTAGQDHNNRPNGGDSGMLADAGWLQEQPK